MTYVRLHEYPEYSQSIIKSSSWVPIGVFFSKSSMARAAFSFWRSKKLSLGIGLPLWLKPPPPNGSRGGGGGRGGPGGGPSSDGSNGVAVVSWEGAGLKGPVCPCCGGDCSADVVWSFSPDIVDSEDGGGGGLGPGPTMNKSIHWLDQCSKWTIFC